MSPCQMLTYIKVHLPSQPDITHVVAGITVAIIVTSRIIDIAHFNHGV